MEKKLNPTINYKPTTMSFKIVDNTITYSFDIYLYSGIIENKDMSLDDFKFIDGYAINGDIKIQMNIDIRYTLDKIRSKIDELNKMFKSYEDNKIGEKIKVDIDSTICTMMYYAGILHKM